MRRGFTALGAVTLGAGFVFLYGPIALVALFSFNDSRLVSVWGGFSARWYASLAGNGAVREALAVSVRVALGSACLATAVGTALATVLVRHGRFRGRLALTGLVYVPLVMPEVVIGLALLLLFVALDVERGIVTLTLAHASFTTSFVAVVVAARLVGLDPDLERAAADLGAGPVDAFASVTLPLLLPAVGAGFLLALTLSFDDLVIASFASGPGATTLPMLIFSQVRRGVTPEINAIGTLLIGFVLLVFALAAGLSRIRPDRTEKGG